MDELQKKLFSAAERVAKNAYAPYSGLHVGAAILCHNGKVYTGCNVENASYGLTCCAERNAVFHAIACGSSIFQAMALVSDGKDIITPCGACRQVLYEMAPQMTIWMKGQEGEDIIETTVNALLPGAFELRKGAL